MQLLVVLLLASVVFFSAALLAGALLLRGQWDKIGTRPDSTRGTDADGS